MKTRITRKDIRNRARKIYQVGYCGIWHLFRDVEPDHYWCGELGWYCDIYYIGDGVWLTSGYQPFGESANDLADRYEETAKTINPSNDQDMTYLVNLRQTFINELVERA